MTYAIAASLQKAIYRRLSDTAALRDIVDEAIYDAVPTGILPPIYVTLGEETVLDRSDKDAFGAWHDFTVSVIADQPGFHRAKQAAAMISDALLAGQLDLDRGVLVGLWFLKAQARRAGKGDQRQIDLRFRAQVSDTMA
ncbi:DUF3168 domain-containing protein [Palleronia sp. LCG004]|uniref:DUF3168 domain-containing protein n=1 Tax=Palleronia sp. LCG004 TaxID=3079304 RepID=UPI0029434494|nr:DUF3168 domain-containing protein [Palleronia sp. LCG004]WOI55012.1 DUF3168 domain-containing protein [Palleronia sp. LCG004]